MSEELWVTAAILVFGWLCPAQAQSDAIVTRQSGPNPPIELCEAFPWDVTVEQSLTAESVSRWRRAMQVAPQAGTSFARERLAGGKR